MFYKIDYTEVDKETFEQELEKYINDYIPCNEYWTPKDKVREKLKNDREFRFPVYDKRYKNRLVLLHYVTFSAIEEEVIELAHIIAQNEYDPCDDDCLRIAVALYNEGYRKLKVVEDVKNKRQC